MSDLNFKIIGQKIKERRQFKGITQEAVANYLEVNQSHISNIECGRANPSLYALVQIANFLECSIDYFIIGEYTYKQNNNTSLDDKIIEKLKSCDDIKKNKILKMIDIL